MRVLLISDQWAASEHSSVEGVFGRGLPGVESTDVVTFSEGGESRRAVREDHRLVLPRRCRRAGLAEALRWLEAWPADVVIVRNWFPVLRQMLEARSALAKLGTAARVGFWWSFPHTYQRLHSARQSGRAVWRKTLEYHFRSWREGRALRRCDFFLPITRTMREEFFTWLRVPWHPLPMGVDTALLPPARGERRPGPRRFAYVGTIDDLRRVDEIVAGFLAVEAPFELHVFTASDNAAVRGLRAIRDDRLRWRDPLPRRELFVALQDMDFGIGFLPPDPLYRVASPTKTVEYYALGLPALLNPLPEYRELFDETTAVYGDFSVAQIGTAVQRALAMADGAVRAMGERGRAVVLARRDYRVLAQELACFLTGSDRTGPDQR